MAEFLVVFTVVFLVFILKAIFQRGRTHTFDATAVSHPRRQHEELELHFCRFSENNAIEKGVCLSESIVVTIKNETIGERCFLSGQLIPVQLMIEEVFHHWAKIENTGNREFTHIRFEDYPNLDFVGSFQIKGINFRDSFEREEADKLKRGDKVILMYEKDNPKDSSAIMVMTESGYHVGYVEKDEIPNIGVFRHIAYAWVAIVDTTDNGHRYISCLCFKDFLFLPNHDEWMEKERTRNKQSL